MRSSPGCASYHRHCLMWVSDGTSGEILRVSASHGSRPAVQATGARQEHRMDQRSNERLPELDGLRALACLMVFFSHTSDFAESMRPAATGGRFGVMLFFVLSGFLMGALYLNRAWDRQSVTEYAVA